MTKQIICPNCGIKAEDYKPCGSFAKAEAAKVARETKSNQDWPEFSSGRSAAGRHARGMRKLLRGPDGNLANG